MEYTQGICQDGAAILENGQPLTIEEILERLRSAHAVNHGLDASYLVDGCHVDQVLTELKTGEYDGTTIMQARCIIKDLRDLLLKERELNNPNNLVDGLIYMKKLMLRNAELMKSMAPELGHHVEMAGAAHITQTWIDGFKEDYFSEKSIR